MKYNHIYSLKEKFANQYGCSSEDNINKMIFTNATIKGLKGTQQLPKIYGYTIEKLILYLFIQAQCIIL